MDTRFIDDEGAFWEKLIVEEMCGVTDTSRLTMKILENHLEEILLEIAKLTKGVSREDVSYMTIAVGYQVLALILLEMGSFVPQVVKEEVLYSTTWDYDRRWGWDRNSVGSRKEFLNKLRDAIKHQVTARNMYYRLR